MPVSINTHNPKIKKERIVCVVCNNTKLCIRFENRNICRPCWNKENKQNNGNKANKSYLWCMYCEICGHLTSEDTFKTCSECKKTTGTCCGRLYHCQSTECTCKKCYDYKCLDCDTILQRGKVYVSDASISSDVIPMCEKCKLLHD